MTRLFLALMLVLLLGSNVGAQEVKEAPKLAGPAPSLAIAVMGKDGNLLITQTEMVFIAVPEKRLVEENGKKLEVTTMVTQTVPVTKQVTYQKRGLQFYGSDGKEIDMAKAVAALQEPTAIVLSTTGNPVDPVYLRMFKEGTLVVVAPPQKGTFPPMAMPKKEMPKVDVIPPPKKLIPKTDGEMR